MYLIQYINAYVALTELNKTQWSYKDAYKLLKLKKTLQEKADFFAVEEMKIVEKFAERDSSGKVIFSEKGKFTFSDIKSAEEYTEKRNELFMTEIDEKIEKISLAQPTYIKPVQIEALEEFVDFKEGDGQMG